jgi:exportin-2 (importin alpha re-exporter)
VLVNFIVPETPKMPPKDRKVAVVGLARMLTESELMLNEPGWCAARPPRASVPAHAVRSRPAAFAGMVRLFSEPQHLVPAQLGVDADADAALSAVDHEEEAAGYQAAYSRIAAADAPPADPVGNVRDVRAFVAERLAAAARAAPRVRELVGAADQSVVGPFVQALRAEGVPI